MSRHSYARNPTTYGDRPVSPRTWRNIRSSRSFEVRNLLLRVGGIEDTDLKGNSEVWRVRLGKAVFTGYGTGTIYCNGAAEPELGFLYEQIEKSLRAG